MCQLMNLTSDLNTVAVFAAFVAPLILIVVYTLAAPWWRNQVGRALVQVKAGIALAMLPVVVHRLTGGALAPVSATFTWVQTATWVLLAAMILRLTWLSYRINRKGCDDDR
jgi:hypothetical protein